MAGCRRHIIGIMILMSCGVWQMNAQNENVLSQYFSIATYYNPAAAGTTEFLNITGVGQTQRQSDVRSRQAHIEADMPVAIGSTRNLGAGIIANYAGAGSHKSLNVSLPVSWRLKAGSGHIAFGISPGVNDSKGDADTNNKRHKTRFDFATGVWYNSKILRAGISATHVGRKQSDTCSGTTYYVMAAGNIALKDALLNIEPSLIAVHAAGEYGGQATLRAIWRNHLWAGAGYRLHESAVTMLGLDIKGFRLGYSYIWPSKSHKCGHEVTAGYSIRLDTSKKSHYRHKSVRIM